MDLSFTVFVASFDGIVDFSATAFEEVRTKTRLFDHTLEDLANSTASFQISIAQITQHPEPDFVGDVLCEHSGLLSLSVRTFTFAQ